jgi:malonate decarboxylase beta subunit
MNGPEVIEQEAGIDELDASDRRRIWQMIGGEQRVATGLADALVDDDVAAIAAAVRHALAAGVPARHRTEDVDRYRALLAQIDPTTVTPATMRAVFGTAMSPEPVASPQSTSEAK